MPEDNEANTPPVTEPVFGFLLLGGPLSGALVRDIRLANELADRGYTVHVWWAVDRRRSSPLSGRIRQHWLFHGFRYSSSRRGSRIADAFGRLLTRILHEKNRLRWLQKRPYVLDRVMKGLVRRVCDSVDGDRRLIRVFAQSVAEARVTHMLPMLSILCPWAIAARRHVPGLKYVVTFQGYELYVKYAKLIDRELDLDARLVDAVEQSDWPAIAVSEDYLKRVVEDIGVPESSLRAIPPGIPAPTTIDREAAVDFLALRLRGFRRDVSLVTFLGRRDTEKGIDLLLYAVSILRRQGRDLQLAVCGPTLFGSHYGDICRQLAIDLRCQVLWREMVSDEIRTALFTASRCIVYPSVHREPFGMVAVEAQAHGTPAIVPDYGGIASAIEANGAVGGLRFRTWDSADLAAQIERVISDDKLYNRLSEAGPKVAAYFSVENLADRVLRHMDLTSECGSKDR
jgi:glycosyltransferase involved in cell wall biosynthesis